MLFCNMFIVSFYTVSYFVLLSCLQINRNNLSSPVNQSKVFITIASHFVVVVLLKGETYLANTGTHNLKVFHTVLNDVLVLEFI